MIHEVRPKTGAYSKHKRLRHLLFDIDTTEFDNSAMVTEYATIWLRHGFIHSSLEDAAEQVALDLKDPGARLLFKREVKRLKKYFHTDE